MSIARMLGITYPIIQGAMAQIAYAELAAAVSNAGGLGVIASGGMSADRLREEIHKCKSLTAKSFGVNLMLMAPNRDELAQLVIDEGVKVVTTGAGSPKNYVAMWKAAGIIVIPVVPSVQIARKMEALGVDAIVAEGTEAGGHVGETTTMVLIPQVADAVSIPVIAAGGIADGRGAAAAFALGAQGVQVGTRFLATIECPAHEQFKQAIVAAQDGDTLVTGRSLGVPVRSIKNRMTLEYMRLESGGAGKEELEVLAMGSLGLAVRDGDTENGSVMAGQIAGLVREINTVQEVITSMFAEARTVGRKVYTMTDDVHTHSRKG